MAGVSTALGAAGTEFAVVTPTLVTGAVAFTDSTNATTATVTLGAAGTYTSVDDVAEALNDDTGFSALFSASVNTDNELVVTSKAGGAVAVAAPGTGIAAGTATVGGLSFATSAGAQNAITVIDNQIGLVSTARANLGALQNRFEHTINNLNVAVENLSASESRIRDTDMAQEMMNFTRAQILSQAGTAMLAQANSAPQSVLSLLRG